ncbi:MAG: histidinol-phosphatase, partial [Chloroflexi bacterium]|nr:histidinol-phosphatase [Chloroflexota bacterium]
SLRRAPEADLAAWLELGQAACDEADAIALRHFRRDLVLERKPDRSFVTVADRDIERAIRARIGAAFPGHGLVGEEYGEEGARAGVRWIIDPIDATHNFMRGIPLFGTLVAVQVDDEVQVGMMSLPAMRQRLWAARGQGAWERDPDGERRLRVSQVGDLADAQLLHSTGAQVDGALMPGLGATLAAAWRDRGFGDLWGYALVAEGAAEAMFETHVSSWDVAAAQAIVEEAGGLATDLAGWRAIDGRSFVATNGLVHAELLRRLAGG